MQNVVAQVVERARHGVDGHAGKGAGVEAAATAFPRPLCGRGTVVPGRAAQEGLRCLAALYRRRRRRGGHGEQVEDQ